LAVVMEPIIPPAETTPPLIVLTTILSSEDIQ